MKNFVKRNIVLILLFILFILPGVLALYVFYHPDLLSQKATNKGRLLENRIKLNALDTNTQKWHLVYWSPENCEENCLKNLEKIAKLRLALGRKLYEVDLDLILTEKADVLSEDFTQLIKEEGFKIEQSNQVLGYKKPKIFLANKEGQLILAYRSDTKPADIFHDLKRLLSNPNAGAKN